MSFLLKSRLVVVSGRQFILRGEINKHRFVTMSQLLDKVLDVEIDGFGRFKYILINVQDDASKASKQIVRGNARSQWHGLFFIAELSQLNTVLYCSTNSTGLFFIVVYRNLVQ